MKCPKCKGTGLGKDITKSFHDGLTFENCPSCDGTGHVPYPCGSLPSWSVEHLRQTLEAMESGQVLTWVKDGQEIEPTGALCKAGSWLRSLSAKDRADRVLVFYGDKEHYLHAITDAADSTTQGRYIDAVRRSKVVVEIGEEVE